MEIQLTTDQVVAMAPDSSSASAAKKLSGLKQWSNLGQSSEALWGECKGSALYQVRIHLSSFTIQCSCPSRKYPCKHGLGLLLLTISTPESVPTAEAPEWVASWLARRAASNKRKETQAATKTEQADGASATPTAAQVKRAEKRSKLVMQGVEQLDLWLNDLIRNGLGSVEAQPATFWEQQAARMVDAQAPGLAARLRRMAAIPNATTDWPEKLLLELGKLALLSHAFQHIEQFDSALQDDIRQLIGWNIEREEVAARGERCNDDWFVLSNIIEEDGNVKTKRTWMVGLHSTRPALALQFSVAGSPFPETYLTGVCLRSQVMYWPGAYAQRVLLGENKTVPYQGRIPGAETLEDFLSHVATALARQPWTERFLCLLHDAIPLHDTVEDLWYIRDKMGNTLPLLPAPHWRLLAFSGGNPVDFVGEWNGHWLKPLGISVYKDENQNVAENTYHWL